MKQTIIYFTQTSYVTETSNVYLFLEKLVTLFYVTGLICVNLWCAVTFQYLKKKQKCFRYRRLSQAPRKHLYDRWKQSPQVFCIKAILNIHRKTPVMESVFNNVSGLRACKFIEKETPVCNFIKKRFQHKCFPVIVAKFLRTLILKNICERLLLDRKICNNIWTVFNRKYCSKALHLCFWESWIRLRLPSLCHTEKNAMPLTWGLQ